VGRVEHAVSRYDRHVELLERKREWDTLDSVLAAAASGAGAMVFIAGEAGIGKTRLVAEWSAAIAHEARIAWGACDDLITPIVLGPFHEIAREVGFGAELLLDTEDRAASYGELLAALDVGIRPTVTVVEDAHWADAASLDLLKYLGRRIGRARVVFVVTFRSDEVGPAHPLRHVMGDLPPDAVVRMTLHPLSQAAVGRLARSAARSEDELYALTGGNPFLLTEFLAAPTAVVPATVADAVFARMGRLSKAARRVAETVSAVPGRCERWLLDAPAAIDECKRQGLLEIGPRAVWYRHELSRRAVENSLDPAYLRVLHGRILAALADAGVDPARLVHHAERAADVTALTRYAPEAARRARSAAAHREAYTHYGRVMPHLDGFAPAEQVALLSEYTAECYFVDDQDRAVEAAEHALELYRQLDDQRGEGAMLRWISRVHWWTGRRDEAMASGSEAIAVLESIDPSAELAMAYSNLAQLHMLAHEGGPAIEWATRAIEVARRVGDRAAEAHALNNLGSALIRTGDESGWEPLEESLSLSLAEGLDEHAARAFSNLGWTLLDIRDYVGAAKVLERGIAFTSNREIHGDLYYMIAERARMLFETGHWSEAETEARWVINRPRTPGITTLPALTTLARLQVRRGDAEAAELLDQAWEQALETGELQRMGPLAIGRAEYAWLRDDPTGVAAAIAPVLDGSSAAPQPWVTDEIWFWQWRAEGRAEVGDVVAEPYALQMAGDWQGAAGAWGRIGCPYEEACALSDGDEGALTASLAIFDRLGARPAASRVRRRLHDIGASGIPRGPRPATLRHPVGLTQRQHEVLELIAAGSSNAEIADRLYISAKTVEHHVSAILAKLEVPSRRDAVERARDLGVLVP